MDESTALIMVTTTIESIDQANELAAALVSQSLVACVQIDGPIISHYRWAGEIRQSNEYRLTIKSSLISWPRLKSRLAKMHPYDEPEIIMTVVDDASDGYRSWVIDQST
ncbi:Divalent-cation tolerance protein CutA [Rubripirellula lacrimiformis]|uniref:Divalent-cation tolerance protein CutA n=2 Tax=Rubripirellula lacrimiformis TaxID=1930273 RepID=A0A517N3N6_9BACT|nr:Divalent-cation tolerance protein CutA [Rubripirellula lacrimiformis]